MSFSNQRRKTLALLASASLIVGLGLGACSSEEPIPPPPAPSPTVETAGPEPEPEPEAEEPRAKVAQAIDMNEITLYADPESDDADPGDVEVDRVLKATDFLTSAGDTPMVFLIEEEHGDWAEVHLPVRPNGTLGWLHADDFEMKRSPYRTSVLMSDYELKLYKDDEVVFQVVLVVGKSACATPRRV